MINLINETLMHPHINTKWTVVDCEKGMLKCVSEDSAKVEWITKEYGLEMYAEQQKQRADQLEKRWEKLKEYFNKEKEQSFGILSWSRNNGMLELMHDLEEDGE